MGKNLVKNFIREDLLFSLCGLNCGLCIMDLDGYCPGCGGGEGKQTCKIAKCSLEHGKIEYCFQCGNFTHEKYEMSEEYDSFIKHRNRFKNLKKMKAVGTKAYQNEQIEKRVILKDLLMNYGSF